MTVGVIYEQPGTERSGNVRRIMGRRKASNCRILIRIQTLPYASNKTELVGRRFQNPLVGGSIPPPAPSSLKKSLLNGAFCGLASMSSTFFVIGLCLKFSTPIV